MCTKCVPSRRFSRAFPRHWAAAFGTTVAVRACGRAPAAGGPGATPGPGTPRKALSAPQSAISRPALEHFWPEMVWLRKAPWDVQLALLGRRGNPHLAANPRPCVVRPCPSQRKPLGISDVTGPSRHLLGRGAEKAGRRETRGGTPTARTNERNVPPCARTVANVRDPGSRPAGAFS